VADLFTMSPLVESVIRLESRGASWRRTAARQDAAQLRESGADVALLLPNSFSSAWLVKSAGIAERWGYATDWRSPLLTRAVPRPRASLHQGAYYQQLTRSVGMTNGPLAPELVVPDAALAEVRTMLTSIGWDGGPFVVLAPGAAYGTAKRWIPSHVAQLVSQVTSADGLTCVLIGSAADRPTIQQVRGLVRPEAAGRVLDLSGRTTLVQMAAVLGLARVCVSNDSGAMHVAAAVGTPVVAVFGPTREYETAPLPRAGRKSEVVLHPVWCRPCMLRECPIDHRCMKRIRPEMVKAAMDRLMESARGQNP
jgi:heptosyltransferase-2